MRRRLVSLFYIAMFLLSAEAFSTVYVNIGAPDFKKPVVAVYCPSKEVEKVIISDLTLSNVFIPLLDSLYPQNPATALMSEWKVTGADYFIFVTTNSGYKSELKLYDLKDGSELLSGSIQRYSEAEDVAHEITSLVYERLTGEKSIFKTKIVTICKDKSNFKNLYLMDYDGRRMKQITSYKNISFSPSFSPDATKVAYTRYLTKRLRGRGNLTVQELYIRNLKTGRETLVSGGTGQNSGAVWSPDGKKIAFTKSQSGDPNIYLYDVDSQELSPLVVNNGLDVEPSFSPDGKFLVFSSSKTGNPELYKIDIETRQQTRLTFNKYYNSSPKWSPSGGSIAFAGLDNPFGKRSYFDIFTVNTSGSNIERFTIDSGNNENPAWSANGRHMIFTSTRNRTSDIYFINSDGTGETAITKGLFCYSPDWSKI